MVANHFPQLVHGVVIYAPSATVTKGVPDGVAWTLTGVPVAQDFIPVGAITGPVLAVAGGDDQLWPSSASARSIMAELDEAHVAYPHQALIYPNAGHFVGTFPFTAIGSNVPNATTGQMLFRGGTRAANEAAKRDSWSKVLTLLAGLR